MNCKQEARNGTCEPNTLRRLHGVHGGKSQSSARDSLRNPDLHFSEASELLGCYLSGVVGFDRPRSIDTPRLSPLRRWIDLSEGRHSLAEFSAHAAFDTMSVERFRDCANRRNASASPVQTSMAPAADAIPATVCPAIP